jgi:hypothetical protein
VIILYDAMRCDAMRCIAVCLCLCVVCVWCVRVASAHGTVLYNHEKATIAVITNSYVQYNPNLQ